MFFKWKIKKKKHSNKCLSVPLKDIVTPGSPANHLRESSMFHRNTTRIEDSVLPVRTYVFQRSYMFFLQPVSWRTCSDISSSSSSSFSSSSTGPKQPLQLPKGDPSPAFGPCGPEIGPLLGVRSSRLAPPGVCVWPGGPLAGLHLVQHR